MTWYRGWPDIRWLVGDAGDLVDQASSLVRDHLTTHPNAATS
jgi:hypothetical protein